MWTKRALDALVARIQAALEAHSMNEIEALAQDPMGRCFLGVGASVSAGFIEFAKTELVSFLTQREPTEDAVEIAENLLAIVAEVVLDEDNAVHAAQLGIHGLLLKLLVHENDRIQEAASLVVVNSSTHNCNTTGINISFPCKTLPLEPPTRQWPQLQPLPRDPRDEDSQDKCVVLIRAVKRRMTGQPKTGYLLWGAAVILARWIHLHRELFLEQTVLEVGSGLGLSGIVAASYSRKTILTDYQQDTLLALTYNVGLNQMQEMAAVEHLDWDHLDDEAPRVDMVIASDIICDPTTAEGCASESVDDKDDVCGRVL
ncbi:hypothetical protein AeMF1_011676 [Aphanomyces euteiches]|nr:hypothetical protein AeMF1_011676 [Aphanomyces euteiches]KAH9188370.1 hypothetical protein AeNC1_009648 [Aphanomyces euteiches]